LTGENPAILIPRVHHWLARIRSNAISTAQLAEITWVGSGFPQAVEFPGLGLHTEDSINIGFSTADIASEQVRHPTPPARGRLIPEGDELRASSTDLA
jgi:hypothetical protein